MDEVPVANASHPIAIALFPVELPPEDPLTRLFEPIAIEFCLAAFEPAPIAIESGLVEPKPALEL